MNVSSDSGRTPAVSARPANLQRRSRRLRAGSGALLATLFVAACGGGSDDPVAQTPEPPPAAAPQTVAIEFAAKAGNVAVDCNTPLGGLGTAGTPATLSDLRFYVSEAVLVTDQNAEVPITLTASDWQNDQVTLIDLEDGTGFCATAGTPGTNDAIRGTVPTGNYTSLKFTLGVPSSHNHTDYAVATSPMDIQAMAWSWQAGRKFAKIEVNPEGGVARPSPAAASTTFYVHLGATGCTGNPATGETVACTNPNRMPFHAPAFDPARQRVVVDLAALFAGANLTTDGGGAPGCMSGTADPECPAVFDALKLDLATGLPAGSGQTLFKVESK